MLVACSGPMHILMYIWQLQLEQKLGWSECSGNMTKHSLKHFVTMLWLIVEPELERTRTTSIKLELGLKITIIIQIEKN